MATSAVKRKAPDVDEDPSKKPKNSSITSFFGAPKAVPSAQQPNASTPAAPPASNKAAKFDKQAWIDSLSDEKKELLKLEIETLHESWLPYLADDLTHSSFIELKKFLKKEGESGKKVFPPLEDVYSWSRHTPLTNVKVVIIGQDPYHNINQAHGMCFSVRPPTPAPPSLLNIYKALKKDYPDFTAPPKKGGLLTPWADRGVLLLNTCLTVQAHQANSHQKKGWERFTKRVLEVVAKERRNGVVFLAWGRPAQERTTGLEKIAPGRHTVLKSVHPSPLSADKGFFDCGHFRKTNEWLKQRYGEEGEIDWDLNVAPEKVGV
ncbi:MAG: hypothetical protein Q9162_003787 [Coniocarpon cinnabarinum]